MKPQALKSRARTKLKACREDWLITELTRGLSPGKNVRAGIGDDCAVIGAPRDACLTLLKTDAVVEGVHFSAGENLRRVGWKAVCRAISDIAAMGGVPGAALITLALSPEMELARARQFYSGLRLACRRFGIAIVGGETVRSPGPLFCSVALSGGVERKRCVLRSGGQPGDALYVTGWLGGSLASGRHLHFIPRVAEARWLTAHFKLHAMMDLSDGLAADLPRLAAASGCGFVLQTEQVPLNRGCTLAQALGDGEDFELLFALPPRHSSALDAAWKKQFPRLRLTRLGALCSGSEKSTRLDSSHGFHHFA